MLKLYTRKQLQQLARYATKWIHRWPSFICEIGLADSIYHKLKEGPIFFLKVILDKSGKDRIMKNDAIHSEYFNNLLISNRHLFNDADMDYSRTHFTRYQKTFQLIRDNVPISRDSKILILGGRLFECLVLKGLFDLSDITVYNLPHESDGKARDLFASKDIKLLGVNIEKDDFPNVGEFFDLVICLETIEHLLYDPMKCGIETNRSLKKSGQFIVTTPNCSSYESILRILGGNNPFFFSTYQLWGGNYLAGIGHPKEWSINEIRSFCISSGFEIVLHKTFNGYGEDVIGNPKLFSFLKKKGAINEEYLYNTHFIIARKKSEPLRRYESALYWGV